MKILEKGRGLIQGTIVGLNSTWKNQQHISKQAGLRVLIWPLNFKKYEMDSPRLIRDILWHYRVYVKKQHITVIVAPRPEGHWFCKWASKI